MTKTNTEWLTLDTITDTQIKALAAEAVAAGDHAQADICHRALAIDVVDQDGNQIAYADWTQDDARRVCVEAINSARAAAVES